MVSAARAMRGLTTSARSTGSASGPVSMPMQAKWSLTSTVFHLRDAGAVHDDLVADLSAALAPERVKAEPLEVTLYGRDASVLEGQAAVVVFPLTTEEVQAAVRVAIRHG